MLFSQISKYGNLQAYGREIPDLRSLADPVVAQYFPGLIHSSTAGILESGHAPPMQADSMRDGAWKRNPNRGDEPCLT